MQTRDLDKQKPRRGSGLDEVKNEFLLCNDRYAHMPPDQAGMNVMMVMLVRKAAVHIGSQYINGKVIWQARVLNVGKSQTTVI